MRTMLLAVPFLFGVFAMSQIATGQDKKDEKKEERKNPNEKKSYTEKVAVRQWASDRFINPVKDIPAFMGEIKGKTVIYTIPRSMSGWAPPKSEIIEADGTVWIVDKQYKTGNNFTYHFHYVTKKDKKD